MNFNESDDKRSKWEGIEELLYKYEDYERINVYNLLWRYKSNNVK